MAIVAGDFSPSQLAIAITTADKMWSDDMMQADFKANVDIVNAVRSEQNAKVSLLEQSEKDVDVRVHWLNMCGQTAVDCDTDDCDLAGPELGSDNKDYSLSVCKQFKFTVDEMTFRTNDYSMEQAVAVGMLKADKALAEAMAATAIARIESFKGVNTVTDGVGTINVGTTETDIATADWTSRLFAYLHRVALMNEFSNPFLLSGSNLYEDDLVVRLSQANAEGKGDANLFKMFRKYFDLFNIDSANAPNYKTYMINRGSLAFASKVHYGAVPTRYIGAGQDRWSIASRNLPGVRYDVFYTNRCSNKTMKHDFKFIAQYDYFLNPTGCVDTRTGVMAFNKV